LGLGFGLVALALTLSVLFTLFEVRKTKEITDRVVELRVPTARASLETLNGINHSLAALRGWMLLGNDKFKTERSIAWQDEIDPAIASLKEHARNWTNPENLDRLNIVESKLSEFKGYQAEIEAIAQTDDNVQASKILLEEAAPKAAILVNKITEMIDIEAAQEATPQRKALLGMMADVRGTTGMALANIRAFLLTGNSSFEESFNTFWSKNERRFGDLSQNKDLLTPEQAAAFEVFKETRGAFSTLPGKMFASRNREVRNLAQRSAEAARNTAAKIEESKANAETGVASSSKVANILQEASDIASEVANLISQVSDASREQSSGINQVNTAITQLDQTTQQTAAQSEQLAAESTQLYNAVSRMQQILGLSERESLEIAFENESNLEINSPRTPQIDSAWKMEETNDANWVGSIDRN
jgi:methyl-accepting chemotaxis protein